MEYKYCNLNTLKQEDNIGTFSGYGSTYGNIDKDFDIIEKGAFEALKEETQFPLYYGHNYSLENTLGSALIKQDDNGLYVKGTFDLEDDNAKKAYRLTKSGLLNSMSIGFQIADYTYEQKDKKDVRIIKKAELKEVSIVPFPANTQALIESVKGEIKDLKQFEKLLRDLGYSRKDATIIASHGYRHFLKNEAQCDTEETYSEILKAFNKLNNTLKRS